MRITIELEEPDYYPYRLKVTIEDKGEPVVKHLEFYRKSWISDFDQIWKVAGGEIREMFLKREG